MAYNGILQTVIDSTTKKVKRFGHVDFLNDGNFDSEKESIIEKDFNFDIDKIYTWNSNTETFDSDDLLSAKISKVNEININTEKILVGTFDYDGHTFNLDMCSRGNYIMIDSFINRISINYPFNLQTAIFGTFYTITEQSDYTNFINAAVQYIFNIKIAGNIIIAQILACTTVEQVNAIVDTRL